MRIEFACTLDGEPLPYGHRERPCEHTGKTCEQDGMAWEIGTCDAHNKTEVGGETVTSSQYSRAQSITTGTTVTSLESGKRRTCNSSSCYLYRAKKAFVRALILRHACGTSFWLCIVVMAGTAFHRCDHWQY